MNFRFKIRLFFFFFVFALFFLFFFSVVFDFSSFNNKKTPKFYNTTFKSEGSYQGVSEEKAKEVLEYFRANQDLYSTLKNNGYKVIGDVNIEKLPSLDDLYNSFSELMAIPEILTTLKKLAFADVYKSFSPTNWIQVFQSYGGRHLIALLKLLGLNDLTVKGKTYTLVHLQKIDWRKQNAQKTQKLIQNIGDLKTKNVSDVSDFDKVKALEELASLVAIPEVKLYDLFDAANKILSTKTGISSEEKMKNVSVTTESNVDPAKMKTLFDYLKNLLYYSLFQQKLFQRGIKNLKIFNKVYSVKAIEEEIWSDETVSIYRYLHYTTKVELEALSKDGVDFFKLISALDYRLHEMLFKAFASKENGLLAQIRKVRYFTFLRKGDDKTTTYSLVNIKKYDFSKVKSFFDIEDEAVRKEMTHLINANFTPQDLRDIFSAGYKQEVLIDKLKLPANKSKILDKMQALELDTISIDGKLYQIDAFRKIDFTKISDEFLNPANRKGPKWEQIKALSDAGITPQQMNAALNTELEAKKSEIQPDVERVWLVLKGNERLADIEKFNVPEIIGKNGEKISLTNLYNLKPQDNYDNFEPEEITTLLFLSKIDPADLSKKIDDAILATRRKTIETVLTWLQTETRLADIVKYKIADETVQDVDGTDVDLSELANIKDDSTYDNLLALAKDLLLKIDETAKIQITASIEKAKENEKAKITETLTWLQTETRLADIQKYNIADETVPNADSDNVVLSELAKITAQSNYGSLSDQEKTLLLKFDNSIKDAIDNLIIDAKAIETVLTWFKEPNRLGDIKKYNIREINEDKNVKAPLSDLSELETGDTYALLDEQEKTLLLKLSKISDAQNQIDDLIKLAKAKEKIETVLTWLKTDNRLTDIETHKISEINEDENLKTALSDLSELETGDTYALLEEQEKTALLWLSRNSDMETKIDTAIEKAKIDLILTWLNDNNRSSDIAKYKIASETVQDDDKANVALSELASIITLSDYGSLSDQEKTLLLKFDNSIKDAIDKLISNAKAIDSVLGWLNEPNLLADIKKYTISDSEINGGEGGETALSDLSDLQTADTYDNLDEKEKTLLLKLSKISDAKTQIEILIIILKAKEKIETVLTWLKKDNRLADITKYNIASKTVPNDDSDNVDLSELVNITTLSDYEGLSNEKKDLLLKFDNSIKNEIDKLINNAKAIETVLVWLKAETRLADIKTHTISDSEINDGKGGKTALGDLKDLQTIDTYESLSKEEKELLWTLSQVSDAKKQIDDLIKLAKGRPNIEAFLAWLKKDNRLNDIKIYSIPSQTVQDNNRAVLKLTELVNIRDKITYESFSIKEKTLLLTLSGITNAKTQIDALIKDLKAGVDDLIKNFQKPNSILTKLKDLNKNKIKVKGKDLSFKNLLKVKVKDWKNPDAFKNMKPEARKELLNIMRSLSNNRKRIPEINSAIEKIENKEKETENINDQVIMWVSIGLGILLLLGVSLFAFKYFKKKNNK